MIPDFCEFFRNIEADPTAITPRITVRDLIALRKHIDECEACSSSMDRVLENAPPEKPFGQIGFTSN